MASPAFAGAGAGPAEAVTLAIEAATSGATERLALLLKLHPEAVNGCDADGVTPLHAAAAAATPATFAIVQLLLAHGADRHRRDALGRTPLALLRAAMGRAANAGSADGAVAGVAPDMVVVS